MKKRMHTSKHYHVVGFVNPDKYLKSFVISELPVYYFADEQTAKQITDRIQRRVQLYLEETYN